MNALNRSLEGIIEIGHEFSSVEALWSQFETVLDRPGSASDEDNGGNTTNDANENTQTVVSGDTNHQDGSAGSRMERRDTQPAT